MPEPVAVELHIARPTDLDPVTIYEILRLRVDVFVVEQACPYPELDGRDLDPATRWVWAVAGGRIVGTLRILADDGTVRIGRVATAPSARSSGVAGRMMALALDQVAGSPVLLDAQSYLEGWYRRFGFARAGAEFVEDGIPHVPMRREPQPGTAGSGVPR
jgi:ElaA protein